MTWKEFYNRIIDFYIIKKKQKEIQARQFILNMVQLDDDFYIYKLFLHFAGTGAGTSTGTSTGKLMEIKILLSQNSNIMNKYNFDEILNNAANNGQLDVLKFFYNNYRLLPRQENCGVGCSYFFGQLNRFLNGF